MSGADSDHQVSGRLHRAAWSRTLARLGTAGIPESVRGQEKTRGGVLDYSGYLAGVRRGTGFAAFTGASSADYKPPSELLFVAKGGRCLPSRTLLTCRQREGGYPLNNQTSLQLVAVPPAPATRDPFSFVWL